ncbi:trans-aconitate 2-methyltransferase protein [Candidatus Micropelagos thuwalensis]|uniref:Trans-aconitate 2-methyltransferase protein n=1 Tax=Candidatus Micropelagius thuwalensis TaxID=1397666 RepID=U2WS74_9PROT|nr:TonB-dependent receptor [Candidatus Micropelagos thuwalensis]ERL46410.1 trans-aconitate 2-methyltransferase protein [Candidatus Micropelagos thuwalensis]
MKNFKTLILSGCAAAVVMPVLPLSAQSIDEIVVTARRQTESLRDVPASVSVLTADALEKTGAQIAEDFVQLTPGVTIVTGTAEVGDTQINIRGMNGARDAESSVALVVDGILKTNTAQLNQNHGTMSQVEILKGPQGAIYGRNAAAGAVVLSTLKPSDEYTGKLKVGLGEHGTQTASGYLSGPLGTNSGFVVSFNRSETDGFYTNRFLNQDVVDNAEQYGIDTRLMVELDSTTWDLKARYAKVDSASINFRAAFQLPAFGPLFTQDVNSIDFEENGDAYYGNIIPTNDQETVEISAKVDHEMENHTLTAWMLYNEVEQDLMADGTSADFARYSLAAVSGTAAATESAAQCAATTAANAAFALNSPGSLAIAALPYGPYSPTTCDGSQYQVRNQKDFSVEARLASNSDGPLQWQAGVYYLDIDREVGVSLGADLGQGVLYSLYNGPTSVNPTSQLYHDDFTTEVTAIFASIDYEASENLNLGFAIRYDEEDREVDNLVPLVADPITGGALNPGQDVDGDGVLTAIPSDSETYDELQPKISMNYAVNDETNIYANAGIGFKSGGFNNSGAAQIISNNLVNGPTLVDAVPVNSEVTIADNYRKETSTAFELGVKGTTGDLTYELAGYYTEVEDMQFFEFFVGTFGLLRVVNNIDEVEIMGVEGSLKYDLNDELALFGSVNYLDSEITSNSARPSTVGNKSPYTSEYTINIGADFSKELNNGSELTARFDYRITGPTVFHTVQGVTTSQWASFAPSDFSIAERDEYGVMNARIGITNGNLKVSAYARNLFDEKFLAEVIPAAEFAGSFVSPGARRLVGVEASLSF